MNIHCLNKFIRVTLSQPTRSRRPKPPIPTRAAGLAFSLLSGAICFAFPPEARSLGFTTGDKLSNPFFYNGNSATSSWTLADPDTLVDWDCDGPKACILSSGTPVDTVTLLGNTGGNKITTWTSGTGSGLTPPRSLGYYVTFNYLFTTDTPDNTIATFLVGQDESDPLETTLGSSGVLYIAANQKLSFKINNIDGDGGSLTISNFSYTEEVPAPLPAAGAATAFSFSRRLRRRTKARDAGLGSGRPRRLPHPTAYLNLSATTVTKIPVSFTYPALRQSDRDVA